ncbi:hypothetical protein FBU30_010631 [Linnemannia zychae]|nr:hypothetical protein FBU30_010631 [Linnemannia zychae]
MTFNSGPSISSSSQHNAAGQYCSDSVYAPSIHSTCNTQHQSSQSDCGENGLRRMGARGGDPGQERTMGLISAILMIVGTLIGTGIFASPGPLFDSVHCTQTSFIIWAFAGVVCTIGAIAYAELGTMFPASGGDFQYLRRAYGAKVAWVFGWCFITILNPISIAGTAGVLGRYAVDLIAYSKTGSSVGASSVENISPLGAAAGATSAAQDAMINTLGQLMWSSINGTAAIWATGAGTSPNPAVGAGHAPTSKLRLPTGQVGLFASQQPQQADSMPWLIRGFSIGAIILMGLINIFFREGGKYASNLLAIFKIAGMCMLIIIGSMQAVKNHAKSEAFQISIHESSQNVLDYVSALCFAFFAFNGFNNINLGLGELRNPERNLKRAVYIAMPFVTILFLLANFAFFAIVSSHDLRHVHSLSLHAGHTVLGQPGGFLMAGTVIASALGSINASLWAGSRLLVIIAKDNTIIPFPVAKVWARTGTQAIAILVLVAQASFHSLINLDFKTFSKIYSAVGWMWYGLSVAGLLYLRKKRPNFPRPVKVWWPLAAFFIVIAAFLVVGSLTLAFMTSTVQKTGSGNNESEDDEDVSVGGGTNGGEQGGSKYMSIIMFGMVILFMMGVIPGFYLTKRYNQECRPETNDNSDPSIVKRDSDGPSSQDRQQDEYDEGYRRKEKGEMVRLDRTELLHSYQYPAITVDIECPTPTYPDFKTSFASPPAIGDAKNLFGELSPDLLHDGHVARRGSAASSVTLVGEAYKKHRRRNKQHLSKSESNPSYHQQQRQNRHSTHQGVSSRSQSLDPAVLGHTKNSRDGGYTLSAEEDNITRVQLLHRGNSESRNDIASLDHFELEARIPSPATTATTSRAQSINNNDDSESDVSSDYGSEETTGSNRFRVFILKSLDDFTPI